MHIKLHETAIVCVELVEIYKKCLSVNLLTLNGLFCKYLILSMPNYTERPKPNVHNSFLSCEKKKRKKRKKILIPSIKNTVLCPQ